MRGHVRNAPSSRHGRGLRRIAALVGTGMLLATLLAPTALADPGHGDRFRDDDGGIHEGYIEAIADAGLTSGCGGSTTQYCPGTPVKRGQMASFLATALDLDTSSAPDHFTDDDQSIFQDAINAVAEAGITSGCGGTEFCPGRVVTRAQMAAFLVAAFALPDADGSTDFDDDDGSIFEGAIESLAAAGITGGCGGNAFCPARPVSRGQMATFIGKALDLTPVGVEHGSSGGDDSGGTTTEVPPHTPAVATDFFHDVTTSQLYTSGTDTWQVWECNVPVDSISSQVTGFDGERVDFAVTDVLPVLEEHVSAYFAWLSEGRYDPKFTAGGVVSIDVTATDVEDACETAALEAATGSPEGVLAIVDIPSNNGRAGIGFGCLDLATCDKTAPDNGRVGSVSAYTVLTDPGFGYPILSTVPHEIMHALDMPHSYVDDGTGSWETEYNNPIDILSSVDFVTVTDGVEQGGGTLAVNRWAAGWLDDADVAVHDGSSSAYRIEPIGSDGVELVAIPTEDELAWIALDVRVKGSYDDALREEGVTVHAIDQRAGVCEDPWEGVCIGINRRQQQLPATILGHDHVLQVGESLTTSGITIEVLSATDGAYVVEVTGTPTFPVLDVWY